jgi:hypothetical protein
MRLKAVERGAHMADRLLYAVIRMASGFRAPDVVRTLRYRKAFFGERELFAAFVSRLNQCHF